MSLWGKLKGFVKRKLISFGKTEFWTKGGSGHVYQEIYDRSDGQLIIRQTYMADDRKRDNPICQEKYEDGQLIEKTPLKNGRRDGLCEYYYENGQLKTKFICKDERPVGAYEEYYENGQLKIKCGYKDRELDGPYEEYYENGQLKIKCGYKDREPDGPYEEYFEKGQLKKKCTHKNGDYDGPFEEYYENGQLQLKCTYKNGERDGLWEDYYYNGQLSVGCTFKDGKTDGRLVSYNKNGSLIEDHVWRDGERLDDDEGARYMKEKTLAGLKQQLAEATDVEKIKKSLHPARTPERLEKAAEIVKVRRAKKILSKVAQEAHREGDIELVNEIEGIAVPYALQSRRIQREFREKRARRDK